MHAKDQDKNKQLQHEHSSQNNNNTKKTWNYRDKNNFLFKGNIFIPKCSLSGKSAFISTYLQRKYWEKTLSVKVSTTITNHLITKYTQRIRTNIGQSKLYWTSKEYWTIITSSFITNIVWNVLIKCFYSTSVFIFIWL